MLKRYKRFLADVRRSDGSVETVHCANSGSMLSLVEAECDAWTLASSRPGRKLAHTLELLRCSDGLACVNTGRANPLVGAWLRMAEGRPEELKPFARIDAEVKFSPETRFDFRLASADGARRAWVEVKSVSLRLPGDVVAFPDAVTTRGQRHLRDLMAAVAAGDEAFLFFVIMRGADEDAASLARRFRPAYEIDPEYAGLLQRAVASGVRVRVLVADLSLQGLGLRHFGQLEWEGT